LGVEEEVLREDVVGFLRRGSGTFDLVFCDPPYDWASRLAGPLTEHLPDVTSEDARIVTESDKRNPLELPFPLVTERTYGDTRIAIHGR
jgi:16S rRNA (guanine966-N2)-methyltransferase